MEMTGAALIVESLKAEGVKHLFGVASSNCLPTLDVVYHTPEIQYIQGQHEHWAMYMANGYARAARKPAVCFVGPGPAITNCTSALSQAYHTFVPSVALAVEPANRVHGLGPLLHHGLDAVSVLKPVTRYATRVSEPGRVPELMATAFRSTMSGRRGPAYVGIAEDIQHEKADVEVRPRETYLVDCHPRSDPAMVARAAELLASAQSPLALVDGEVVWAQAQAELIELAELLAMPVGEDDDHTGIVPRDHPLSLGPTGLHSPPYALEVIQGSDVILALGSPLTEFTTAGFGHTVVPKGARIVQVDTDSSLMGTLYPVEAGIVGDLKTALQDLIIELKERLPRRPEYRDRPRVQSLMRGKQLWLDSLRPKQTSSEAPIHPLRLQHGLRQALPRDAIVICQSGGTHGWYSYSFEAFTPNMGVGAWHPLGAEYCEALGVKVALPERTVVCLTGDGSAMMSLPEIATAAAYNIQVLYVVCHNGVFGNMRATQVHRFGGRFIGTTLNVPHLANVARELGAYAERVEQPEDIGPAVKRALDSGRPSLLEVMMDTSPEALVPPRSVRATGIL